MMPPAMALPLDPNLDVLIIVCSPSVEPLPEAVAEADEIAQLINSAGGKSLIVSGERAVKLNQRMHDQEPRVVVFIGHADCQHPSDDTALTLGLCGWLLVNTDPKKLALGGVALALGVPFYVLARRRGGQPDSDA